MHAYEVSIKVRAKHKDAGAEHWVLHSRDIECEFPATLLEIEFPGGGKINRGTPMSDAKAMIGDFVMHFASTLAAAVHLTVIGFEE